MTAKHVQHLKYILTTQSNPSEQFIQIVVTDCSRSTVNGKRIIQPNSFHSFLLQLNANILAFKIQKGCLLDSNAPPGDNQTISYPRIVDPSTPPCVKVYISVKSGVGQIFIAWSPSHLTGLPSLMLKVISVWRQLDSYPQIWVGPRLPSYQSPPSIVPSSTDFSSIAYDTSKLAIILGKKKDIQPWIGLHISSQMSQWTDGVAEHIERTWQGVLHQFNPTRSWGSCTGCDTWHRSANCFVMQQIETQLWYWKKPGMNDALELWDTDLKLKSSKQLQEIITMKVMQLLKNKIKRVPPVPLHKMKKTWSRFWLIPRKDSAHQWQNWVPSHTRSINIACFGM